MTNKYPTTRYKSELLGEEYKKIIHPSGLTIFVFPKNFMVGNAALSVRFGAIHSKYCTALGEHPTVIPDGVAHFLEHMMFKGSDGDKSPRFAAVGADVNAFTSQLETTYYFSCAEQLDAPLTELVSLVTQPYFTEDDVKSESTIIADELNMYLDSPESRCYRGMLMGLYRANRVRNELGGTAESISKITPQLLYDTHKIFYTPSNMTLAVCADTDAESVLRALDSALPTQKSAFTAFSWSEDEPNEAFMPYVEQTMPLAAPVLCIGFKLASAPCDEGERTRLSHLYELLFEVLFSESGELYCTLMDLGIILDDWSYGCYVTAEYSYGYISAKAYEPKAVFEKIMAYLETLMPDTLSKERFIRAKRSLYADAITAFDSTAEIVSTLICKDYDDIFSIPHIINSITFEELQSLYKDCFTRKKATLSAVLPPKPQEDKNT